MKYIICSLVCLLGCASDDSLVMVEKSSSYLNDLDASVENVNCYEVFSIEQSICLSLPLGTEERRNCLNNNLYNYQKCMHCPLLNK